MQHVHNLIGKVADTDSIVLTVGESGTGKELVARGLHLSRPEVFAPDLHRAFGRR